MKVYSIVLFDNNKIIKNNYDVSQFGYFERNSIKEFFIFISKLILKKTEINKRLTVENKGYNIHCYKTYKNGVVIISDIEYPERPIYNTIYEICKENDFSNDLIKEIQDPKNYDKISLIQNQLDNTITIMHENIDKVLDRGEKLENLIEKSEDLSIQSKAFYRAARKHNQKCCIIS